MKKYILPIFSLLFILDVYAQINMESAILNEPPSISEIQTYSRYDSSTDNFPETDFYICSGEENRTIHLRILAQDNNSHIDISQGGNVSFKVVSIINNSEITVPSFGNSFKSPVFESTSGITGLSYIDNITLLNTSSYRIIANVTDASSTASQKTFNFVVNNTNCVRVEENVSLITNQTYSLQSNFTEISIVVDENVTGEVIITEHDDNPVGENSAYFLDKYVTVDITGPIKNVTVNLTIVVTYDDLDLDGKDVDEDSLELYSWNDGEWELRESTINIVNNTIIFTVEGSKDGIADVRLGTFSIKGSEEASSSSSSGGGGGGGGSGGGSSATNIVLNEKEYSGGSQKPIEIPEKINEEITEEKKGNPSSKGTSLNKTHEFIPLTLSGMAIHEFLEPTFHEYCYIIIIILLLLWVITLSLLIMERKNRRRFRIIKY